MPKDTPILFSGPMVRALIDGRKTQTRRVLSRARVFATPEQRSFSLKGDDLARALQNASRFRRIEGDGWFWESDTFPWQAPAERTGWMAHIGYAPGDRLWVRERLTLWPGLAEYTVDGLPVVPAGSASREWIASYKRAGVPSIHMPRWASRLTLEVTDVRVERLQAISHEDAIAEGVDSKHRNAPPGPVAVTRFAALWDSINGAGAWEANPWVVAISFTPHRRNIDTGAQKDG